VRFVVFADVHLDASFAWAGADRGVARRWRSDLRRSLMNIVELAVDRRADALLCAGDLYEHDRFTPDTQAFLAKTFAELAPLQVFLAPGNHDWFGPQSLYETIDWSSNVHVFGAPELEPYELAPGLTLWGGAHLGPANTGGFVKDFTVDRDGVNLGLFHGSELSWLHNEDGSKIPHAPFKAEEIAASGLDHAFVGHLHSPRLAARHTYPGNPNPLAFGETGERGAVVVDVAGDGSIERTVERVAVTELHERTVDVTGCSSRNDVLARVRDAIDGVEGVARIDIVGDLQSEIDLRVEDIRSEIPIEAVMVRTDGARVAYDFEAIAEEGATVRGRFVRDVLDADLDEDERRRVLVAGLRALDGRKDLEVA
jgi:DNA repair exonuclease SbcCD nuclease subunit